jgi:type I restriction enzyme, R subunit
VTQLLNVYDPDTIENVKCKIQNEKPGATPAELDSLFTTHHSQLIDDATAIFNDWELRNYVIEVRKKYDQYIDHINLDERTTMGSVKDNKAAAGTLVHDFTTG